MNAELVSSHCFLYYEDTSKIVLDTISKFYKGVLYLSLIENNCSNDVIINYAKHNFDETKVIYVSNHGTDQYGFFYTLQYDIGDHPWIFYSHDKHNSKLDWLQDLLNIYIDFNQDLLLDKKIGIISSKKHKHKALSYEEIFNAGRSTRYENRKGTVQCMHTTVWLNELTRILLDKFDLYQKEAKYPYFTAGNIFLIRRNIVQKAHECIYKEFFNKNCYKTDGEIGHALERFYYYVSQCMGYTNTFI